MPATTRSMLAILAFNILAVNSELSSSANILLGTLTQGFAGTVVTAASCTTTYALTCTDSSICPQPVTVSATAGPTAHEFHFTTSVSIDRGEGQASMSQSCSFQGSTVAICDMKESISFNGQSSTAHTRSTLSGDQLVLANVPITGGTSERSEATEACSAATIATGSSKGAARPTGLSRFEAVVVKVMVPLIVGTLV